MPKKMTFDEKVKEYVDAWEQVFKNLGLTFHRGHITNVVEDVIRQNPYSFGERQK